MDDEEYDEQDRKRNIVLGGLVGLAVIAVLVAVGTTVFVKALGLDEAATSGPVEATEPEASVLPTKAIEPRHPKSEPPANPPPSMLDNPNAAPRTGIRLSVTPVIVNPMERINLTGNYAGKDNLVLLVQRWEAGGWSDFGVSATVRVGTFETYVMTGRSGDNRFRMFDPETGKGSNPVVVTVE